MINNIKKVYARFPFDDFKTDNVLQNIVEKSGGDLVGAGLGPGGRENVFEFVSGGTDKAYEKMNEYLKPTFGLDKYDLYIE